MREGEIKDAAKLSVLSNWVDEVAVCWVQNTKSRGLDMQFEGCMCCWDLGLEYPCYFIRAGTTVCQKKGLLINTFYFHFPIALGTFLHVIYIAFSFSSSFCIHLSSEIPGNEIIQIHILWSSILISIARIQNKLQGKGQKKKGNTESPRAKPEASFKAS